MVAIAVSLLLMTVVAHAGFFYQAFRGSTLEVEGWTVPVPKGFYVYGYGGDPAMWTHDFGVPWFRTKQYGHIVVRNVPSVRFDDVRLQRLGTDVVTDGSKRGFALVQAPRMSTESGFARCWELRREHDGAAEALCIVEDTHLVVTFQGSARYAGAAYDVLRGARRNR